MLAHSKVAQKDFATQLTNPLPGFEFVLTSPPYLSLSTCMSSLKVFFADDLVVVYMVG